MVGLPGPYLTRLQRTGQTGGLLLIPSHPDRDQVVLPISHKPAVAELLCGAGLSCHDRAITQPFADRTAGAILHRILECFVDQIYRSRFDVLMQRKGCSFQTMLS